MRQRFFFGGGGDESMDRHRSNLVLLQVAAVTTDAVPSAWPYSAVRELC